jgi:hypothetical protein
VAFWKIDGTASIFRLQTTPSELLAIYSCCFLRNSEALKSFIYRTDTRKKLSVKVKLEGTGKLRKFLTRYTQGRRVSRVMIGIEDAVRLAVGKMFACIFIAVIYIPVC